MKNYIDIYVYNLFNIFIYMINYEKVKIQIIQ